MQFKILLDCHFIFNRLTNQRKEEPKMGLVYCPKCGEEISDKAISCPHCNFAFSKQNIVKCDECGMEYESNLSACPK